MLLHGDALIQERGRPPKVHLQDTVEEMHKFNAIRKLKVIHCFVCVNLLVYLFLPFLFTSLPCLC